MALFGASGHNDAVGEGRDLNDQTDRPDLPPHPVIQYIERYRHRYEDRPLAARRLAEDTLEVSVVFTERFRDTVSGACIRLWWHWDDRGVTDSLSHYWDTNSP